MVVLFNIQIMMDVRKSRWTTKQLMREFLEGERVKKLSRDVLEDTLGKLKDIKANRRLVFEEICIKEDVKRREARTQL